MSREWDCSAVYRPRTIALKAMAMVFAASLAIGGFASGVGAQATPAGMASPASGECMAIDAAAPAADTAMEGTPEAAPAGTPVTDQAVTDAAIAAAENFANCWNAGDLESVLTLVTPNLLATKFLAASPEDAAAALEGMGELPAYTIVTAENAQTYDDGRASLDLVYMFGDYQLVSARWYMVMADDALLIDAEELMLPQPEGDSTVVSFTFAADGGDVAFDQGVDEETGVRAATLLPAIILHATNADTAPRMAMVVRIPDAMAGTPVAADSLPADAEFVAVVTVGAEDQVDIALVGLSAGDYVLYEAGGAAAPFNVAEPEA